MEGTQETPFASTPPPRESLDRALALVEFLRARCAWDAAQTPETLVRHLVEETNEVVDAIVRKDDAALCDELGDLLLNLAFQLVLGEERGTLSREVVVHRLEEKMRRRHPHLYGRGEQEPWDVIKARERSNRSGPARSGEAAGVLAELPRGLDPLHRAHRMQELVARVGFDWPDAMGAWLKVREEVEEVGAELASRDEQALRGEIGDLLFAVVNLARRAGVYASDALALSNAKFVRRFEELEALAAERELTLGTADLADLDHLWDEVKARERAIAPDPSPPEPTLAEQRYGQTE